ncbi:MAG: cytochrome b N-terminal domain-containing protein [Acidobacteriota bacterium]
MMQRLGRWIDERTGIPAGVRRFLDEEIPASAGWPQVLGSVALFLLLTQAFTGVLLAINYAPSPGEAYYSLKYIVTAVTAGRMVRGLHHWGASMMVVVVVLHMTQVFVYGAYKKPREVTWMIGVALLLATLAFGLTGYLLPWDNRAYWGTVVTTQIAGEAPVLGRYILRLMGAESGVGSVTFARFYALHTLVLPAAAFLLAGIHVYLVRRHGVTPSAAEAGPRRKFYPAQAFKDTCAIFAAFAILFVLAAVAEAPLERMADPTDSTYIPRPEWYFLFLFQTLKFFSGAAEVIGAVVLPGAAIAALFAVPFIDRTRVRRLTGRTAAIGIVALCGGAWTALTAAAVLTTPRQHAAGTDSEPWTRLTAPQLAGLGYYRAAGCSACHNLSDGQPKAGPNLAQLGTTLLDGETLKHFNSKAELSNVQVDAIVALLRRLTPEQAEALSAAPPEAAAGAQIFLANGCAACHMVNGAGGGVGPPLNGLSRRRTREWVAQHLRDPKSQTPGTAMPPFQFTEQDRDRLIAYLFALPERTEDSKRVE